MNEQIQRLERLVEDWAAAELRGDTAFLGRALADDFVGVGPRGFTLSKEDWLERHDSGKLKYESFEWNEAHPRLYGETAVITGRQTATGSYEQHDLQGQFRATLVFVKQAENWLLASLHLSPIAGRP